MTEWFRSWHGAPTDSKWLVIAKRSGIAPALASAIAWALFDHASQASPRGCVQSFDCEAYAAWGGLEPEQVAAVITAMRDRGMIDADGVLANWRKRQPEREDGSAERARLWRERNRTHINEPERKKEQTRTEQNREESIYVDADAPTDPLERENGKGSERQELRSLGEQWNALARSVGLPQIDEIQAGSPRERAALARIREGRDFEKVFAKIRAGPLLLGKNGAWRADFNWVMNPTNMQKILEGNYDEVRKEPQPYVLHAHR